jgi:hypothetical protein
MKPYEYPCFAVDESAAGDTTFDEVVHEHRFFISALTRARLLARTSTCQTSNLTVTLLLPNAAWTACW